MTIMWALNKFGHCYNTCLMVYITLYINTADPMTVMDCVMNADTLPLMFGKVMI